MTRPVLSSLVATALLAVLPACNATGGGAAHDHDPETTMLVEYLEIVTPDVDATCSLLESVRGVRFGAPNSSLGAARTASLEGGGRIGVRAPMHAEETPVVRPYVLVDDVAAAVEAAEAAGAEIALPPMEVPGEGTFAIYFLGGIQHGLWQR